MHVSLKKINKADLFARLDSEQHACEKETKKEFSSKKIFKLLLLKAHGSDWLIDFILEHS